MRSLGQFQAFLFFFLRKDFTKKKTKKHKNAHKRTKTKKGSVFMRLKTSKKKKVTHPLIYVFMLFMRTKKTGFLCA